MQGRQPIDLWRHLTRFNSTTNRNSSSTQLSPWVLERVLVAGFLSTPTSWLLWSIHTHIISSVQKKHWGNAFECEVSFLETFHPVSHGSPGATHSGSPIVLVEGISVKHSPHQNALYIYIYIYIYIYMYLYVYIYMYIYIYIYIYIFFFFFFFFFFAPPVLRSWE